MNILILITIIYILFLLKDFLSNIAIKFFNIFSPFILSFIISYALYPITNYLHKLKIPMKVAAVITIIAAFIIIILTIYFTVPVLYNQTLNFISSFNNFLNIFLDKYNININLIKTTFNKCLFKIINNIDKHIFNVLSISASYLTKLIITIICSIYFLFNMEKIRRKVHSYIMKSKLYNLISNIDNEVRSYIKGIGINMIIQFFEYTLLFLIIGHPNYLLIGFLSSITTIIPIFGGLITGLIALITAFITSRRLFLLTIIVIFIFTNIDSYIISPRVYNKTNQLPVILTIISVTIGSLFGFIGILLSIPILITIISIIKTYSKYIKLKILHYKPKI